MTPRCPFGHKESSPCFSSYDFNLKLSDQPFSYHICASCRTIFLHPIPEDLGTFYPPTYPAYEGRTEGELLIGAERDQYKLDLLSRFAKGGKLLEIGPGYGGFAYLAKNAGFEVEAIEMDKNCCRFLSNVVGIKARHSADVIGALSESPSYDVIALWHVLEHLPDPSSVLRALSSKLNEGGKLIIAIPNRDSIQFKVFARFWAHLDAPRHLTLIPPRYLNEIMNSYGLEMVFTTTNDDGSAWFGKYNWWDLSMTHCLHYMYSCARHGKWKAGLRIHALPEKRISGVKTIRDFGYLSARSAVRLFDIPFYYLVIAPFQRREGSGATLFSVYMRKL